MQWFALAGEPSIKRFVDICQDRGTAVWPLFVEGDEGGDCDRDRHHDEDNGPMVMPVDGRDRIE
eukprot:1522831-Rhodomonas_salina.1